MCQKAEEGMIADGRDAEVQFARRDKSNQSQKKFWEIFLLWLASFVRGNFNTDARTHIWKTESMRQSMHRQPRFKAPACNTSANIRSKNPRIFNLHFVILSKLCTDTNFSKYWYVCVLFSIYCFYLLEKISYFLVFFSSVLLGGCLDRDWTETDRDVLHFGMTSSPV